MSSFINATSARKVTSGSNLSSAWDKSMTFSIAAAKLRWNKERQNDANTLHRKVLVSQIKIDFFQRKSI